jgi:transcriptional regulator with XRE-family HTH domain
MTRKEFSEKLVECRENAGCGKNELCRRTGFTFNQLQRLENASNNFSIDNVFSYLKAIGYKMYIIDKYNNNFYFKNREVFARYFKKLRDELGVSQRVFATQVGLSYTAITGIEYGNANTSIDNILIVIEKLGCEITFKKVSSIKNKTTKNE